MGNSGKVFLVGAGPGDPGLITLKALQCLAQADFVLYDGLVNPLLLLKTSATTERTCRSCTASGRLLDQSEINRRLIEAAQAGKTVVRLKGGDPFVFGRGGEEAAALRDAGIDYEIVPGVTAATGASAYAGISLTHRKFASAVAFVTGHEDPEKPDSTLDYNVLAKFPGTLVFYMGLHRLERIVQALIAAGKPGETPAAVVSRGTTAHQKTIEAPLGEITAATKQAKIHAPSLIIIGDCVQQRETLRWFEDRPLMGLRIGIPRPAAQAESVVEHAFELGADCVVMPTIEIRPPADWTAVDDVLSRLAEYDCLIFTSVNGVQGLLNRLWETGGDLRRLGGIKVAAIGSSTAQELARFHIHADLVPEEFRGEALAAELAPMAAGKKTLWARANRGRDVLPQMLNAAGAVVDKVVVYQNVDLDQFEPQVTEVIEKGELDWIGLSSPSIARGLARMLTPAGRDQIGKSIRLASISPVTSAAAAEVDLPIHAEAEEFTWAGILAAIERVQSAG